MTQELLNERIKILPVYGTLRQGQKNVGDQFAYHYNIDERTDVAAQFHRAEKPAVFRSSGQRPVKPGDLLQLLPKPTSGRFFRRLTVG